MPMPHYNEGVGDGLALLIGIVLIVAGALVIVIGWDGDPRNPWAAAVSVYLGAAAIGLGVTCFLVGLVLRGLYLVAAQVNQLHQTIYNGDSRTPPKNPPPSQGKSALGRLAGIQLKPLKD